MSNYPDNFSQSAFERHYRQPEDVLPADAENVYSAQACYRECMEACVKILKEHGFTSLKYDQVRWLCSGVDEALSDAVESELANFSQLGMELSVQDDDHKQFIDKMYALLKEAPHA